MANKYNARKVTIDGHTFDSRKEAKRYQELKMLMRAGEISALALQPKFELQPAFEHNGKHYRSICYYADFEYIEEPSGNYVVEDVKGMMTDVFRLKMKLFLYQNPNIDFRMVK